MGTSKLQEILAKIQARGGKLPDSGEFDDFLNHFILEKMPSSNTLQEAFDIGFVEMEMLYAEGYNLYTADAFEEAIPVFQWLAILNPFTPKFWMGLGVSLLMLKSFEKALKIFAVTALVDPDHPLPHYYAALCYDALREGVEKQKALNLSRRRAQQNPKFADLMKKIECLGETRC